GQPDYLIKASPKLRRIRQCFFDESEVDDKASSLFQGWPAPSPASSRARTEARKFRNCTMDAGIIVLATVAVAGWTWVVTDLDEKGRRSLRARSVALLIGIWLGLLAAIALHLVRELAGSEWLEAYEWPLALAVCAIEYVRRTYKAEHASDGKRSLS